MASLFNVSLRPPESTDHEISEALLGPGAAFAVSHQSDYPRPVDEVDGQCVGGSFCCQAQPQFFNEMSTFVINQSEARIS